MFAFQLTTNGKSHRKSVETFSSSNLDEKQRDFVNQYNYNQFVVFFRGKEYCVINIVVEMIE